MPAKILIVTDSAVDRLKLQNLLMDYYILTASDGWEAMQEMDDNTDLSLIILDLNLPNMEGYQLLKKLKTEEEYQNLRTIILTDNDKPEHEINGLKMGAADFIRKPINRECLKSRVEIHLELLRIRQLYEEMLFGRDLTLDTILNQVPIGITILHSDKPFGSGIKSIINPVFEQITGRTKEELIKVGWGKITHPDDRDKDRENFEKLKSGKISSYSMEKRYIKPDGSIVWVYMVVARLNLDNTTTNNHICIVQEITKRKEMEKDLWESERSKSVLLANLPGIAYRCDYDREWTMQFVSQGSYELTGYKAESLIGNKELSYNQIIAPEYREAIWLKWEEVLRHRLPFEHEYEIITASGKRKWVLEKAQGIFDELGNVEALEGIIIDISDRKNHELRNQFLLEHDTLTGLHNRRHLEELLEHDAARKENGKRALLNMNLCRLDILTLAYGFNYVQVLFKKISDVLLSMCINNCQLFATYSNRFTFYVKNYYDKNDLIQFCHDIEDILGSTLETEGIGVGIGILEIEEQDMDVKDVKGMLKNVLIASENALNKPDQHFNYVFFDQEMESKILRKRKIKEVLEKIAAGEENYIYLQFQPILDLKANHICSFEALSRIKSNELGIIPPLEFIPIAEETKLIVPIGKRIIFLALSFLNKLKTQGYDSVKISINVSLIQLLTNDFNATLFALLEDMGVDPTNLIIEITESVFSDNFCEINKKLKELKASGIEIAVDDFGTGYSSLARERELNINCLKIDKYFIDELVPLNHNGTITGDIISMAHKLEHYVVAEGVEHEVQKEYLIEHGCDKMQGYLISRPLDEEAALDLLEGVNDVSPAYTIIVKNGAEKNIPKDSSAKKSPKFPGLLP
ncbi:EAL domain-containing protein [Dehalobacterium formicoaceticum]|uniref:Stage 0 sporulation protein A homolog n=1 Tax=Dehalobacterium formicoaceticum TaxID=51515 RepID=A0ABT1Y291_9FIRM|nr:EAL domain-containing protein [Dehalobacterium formicoaceticum]MCR6544300.1 EAL domain-containing protein [Dehalobacterium formicoaceticum]